MSINGKIAEHLQANKSGYLLGTLPLIVAMATMTTYLHLNFASAADLGRVEAKIDKGYILDLKRYLRELNEYLANDPEDRLTKREIEETLDELCYVHPEARECDA